MMDVETRVRELDEERSRQMAAPASERVARRVYEAMLQPEDVPFDDLAPVDRELLADHAQGYMVAHVEVLTQDGFRILPPSAAVIPKTDEEATGMLLAVKAYRDAQKRKGGLLVQQRKLILPPQGSTH